MERNIDSKPVARIEWNIKNTHSKETGKERRASNKEQMIKMENNKMVSLNSAMWIVTLNVNFVCNTVRGKRLSD